ncbi:lysine N(6)-hydroxylase/L-ornithine N(5)-oxygenase family protein [Shouchella patagoniensis]|uniref:lysine N(6)-hydroxylase/L-ornithine N(5)-oxygenase family protein n=1 Tax=Shouchella patagoniensis TaxID=228576 RepID=UPI0011177455|nr:SidA/IucD/PvdA family monooxygenase [Shouchella patagoniensis]
MEHAYDVVGIGIGPFNLGLAALISERTDLKAAFFDENNVFQWHPGMLLDGTDLQVPFLADLVTLANPMSRYSFLNYAHTHNRLMSFFMFNRFDVPRMEYNAYCQWVSQELDNCHFGNRVENVTYDRLNERYILKIRSLDEKKEMYAKHLIVGTGSSPLVPGDLANTLNEDIIHSSDYKGYEKELKEARSITVVGSGQSAAEIFYKLLESQLEHKYELSWFTRSAGFFQLEYSKIGQELFSPDYVDYFHRLPYETRKEALPLLGNLRNGVQQKTLHKIFDMLYHRSIQTNRSPALIRANMEVKQIEKVEAREYVIKGKQWQEKKAFAHKTEKVILATGYKPQIPDWLQAMTAELVMESEKEFAVTRNAELVFKEKRNNRIFTLTNLEHSLGTSATNLGLSVERNARIVNELMAKEVYQTSPGHVFQQFSIEKD